MTSPHLLSGLGAALSMFLSAAGSSCASVPAGMFAQHAVGFTAWAPIIVSGVLSIYGCIIAVIISHNLVNDDMTEAQGYRNLSSGLAAGLSCLASGLGLAKYIDRYTKQQLSMPPRRSTNGEMQEGLISEMPKPIVPTLKFLAVLAFIEAIGLYGLIVALLMSANQ